MSEYKSDWIYNFDEAIDFKKFSDSAFGDSESYEYCAISKNPNYKQGTEVILSTLATDIGNQFMDAVEYDHVDMAISYYAIAINLTKKELYD